MFVFKESLRLHQGFSERIDTLTHSDIGVIWSGAGYNLQVDISGPDFIDYAINALFKYSKMAYVT